jgi:hypothetical protein
MDNECGVIDTTKFDTACTMDKTFVLPSKGISIKNIY